MDGGAYTLLRAQNAMGGRRPYAAIHGAGYRAIPRDREGDDERGGDGFAVPPHVPAIDPTGPGQRDKPPTLGDILPPV